MVKYLLNELFSSLSDQTRRDMLRRLLPDELTVSQLAEAYGMSLPAVSKHVKTLEVAGLVVKEKRGRQWFVRLSPAALKEATGYLLRYEATLHSRLDSFGAYVQQKTATQHDPASAGPHAETQQTITITETLNVAPATAWHAYADPDRIKQWWSLPGAQLVHAENDVRVDGNWRFTVRGADGHSYILGGTYSAVEAPYRLEYTDGIGEPGEPRPEAHVAVIFKPLPDGTTLLTKKSTATPAIHHLNAAWYQVIGGS